MEFIVPECEFIIPLTLLGDVKGRARIVEWEEGHQIILAFDEVYA